MKRDLFTTEGFEVIHDFLGKYRLYPQSELEAAYMCIHLFSRLDLSMLFGSHFDDIDERRVYSFVYTSVTLKGGNLEVRAILNFSDDFVIANAPLEQAILQVIEYLKTNKL